MSDSTQPALRALTPTTPWRWWVAILVTGVLAGVMGAATDLFTQLVEWTMFGHSNTHGDAGVAGAALWRRLTLPLIGAWLAAEIWMWVRHHHPRGSHSVGAATKGLRLDPTVTVVDATAQLLSVGSGLAMGREVAPRQLAALMAQHAATWFRINFRDSLSLVAAGAGAGLAASYNTPLGGVAMTIFLLSRRPERTWRRWYATVIINVIATVVAWPVVHSSPAYHIHSVSWRGDLAALRAHLADTPVTLVAVALASLLTGWLFTWVMKKVLPHALPHRYMRWTIPCAVATVAVIAIWIPQLPGNGRTQAQLLLLTAQPWSLLAAFLVLRIAMTALSLWCGASSGMLTPALATGATTGAAIAAVTGVDDPRVLTIVVMAGMATTLGTTQRSAIFGLVFTLELCHPSFVAILTVALSVTVAHGINEVREYIQHAGRTWRQTGHSREELH